MKFIAVDEKDGRLTVGPHERVLRNIQKNTIFSLLFGCAVAAFAFWQGFTAGKMTSSWWYAYFLLVPIAGLGSFIRLHSARHGGMAFRFDHSDGSVWKQTKDLSKGRHLQVVRIQSRFDALRPPEIWLVFEGRSPLRILDADALAIMGSERMNPLSAAQNRPEATAEVIAAAQQIAQYMGVALEDKWTLRGSPRISMAKDTAH